MIPTFLDKIHRTMILRLKKMEIPCGTTNKQSRDLWIRKALSTIPPGSRILDAGAGEQQYRLFCSHLHYISQDFAQYDGKGNHAGLQVANWRQKGLDLVSDITAIPEPDESFDAVMCTEVFEHLPDPVAALREFHRLLKSGGKLILTAPFCSLTHFAPYHYYSGFNRYFYKHWLPISGFEILEIQPNGNYFEYIAQEIRRVESVASRYAEVCLTKSDRGILHSALCILDRISRDNQGSDELLCFGYHALAKKI